MVMKEMGKRKEEGDGTEVPGKLPLCMLDIRS
jgi:hypothetical protein